MRIVKTIGIISCLLFIAACGDGEKEKQTTASTPGKDLPPPPKTVDPEHDFTLSCTINGESWHATSDRNKPFGRYVDPLFTIGGLNSNSSIEWLEIDIIRYNELGKYYYGELSDNRQASNIAFSIVNSDSIPKTIGYAAPKDGFVEVLNVDSANYRMTGRFEFTFMDTLATGEVETIRISNGFFTNLYF
jgi:hypothetical protein